MSTVPIWRSFLGLPSEKFGWLSTLLAFCVFAFYGLFLLFVRAGYRGGDTFWSNPPLALCVIAMGACGIGGGALAVYSIARKADRSFLVIAALLVELFVLAFAVGELKGH